MSVVISTINRGESLRRTLMALRYQRYENFEVIVVEGPSVQLARGIVEEFGGAVRYLRCPDANLSRSRNIGIAAASGDLVAFIDDDAVAETNWLGKLAAACEEPGVAGAGGIVYDYTGTRIQYRYSRSDRVGRTVFNHDEPLPEEQMSGAETFPYLQGTNMSFRRDLLAEVGGFDEEIEYNFDEVEVCLRLIDRGYELRSVENAAVYHKYLPSHVRNSDRVFTDPYLSVKNRVYFALRHGRGARSTDEILLLLREYVEDVRASARSMAASGQLTQTQLDFFVRRVEEGFEMGLKAGLAGGRKGAQIPVARPGDFRHFARLAPGGNRLTTCFLSQEYPPGDFGGVGRYTAELARGFADRGHEVHVFTRSLDEIGTLDFEAGCWVHRVPVIDKRLPELEGNVAAGNLYLLAANYHEVKLLHETARVDVISAPLWLCEGLCCSLDAELATATTLVTSMKTVADLHPSWRNDAHPQAMLRLEREAIARADGLHAISNAILQQVTDDYPAAAGIPSFVVPLGVEDRRERVIAASRENGMDAAGLTVLFVGRLEVRKGVDVLLESATQLMRELPTATFVIAGKDTINTETGAGYRETFQQALTDEPEILRRVRFLGQVDESELWALYRDCDIFCAPSRFESFGLVLVEAMMFGKAVVASATGGIAEVVKDGETGLLAVPGDVGSLTHCLRRMLTDDDLRARCGQAGRARYLAEYELHGIISRTAAAYTEFAGGKRSGRVAAGPHDIRSSFAEVIARVAKIPLARASTAADRLLDPTSYPVDVRLEIERAWSGAPRDYVATVYMALLRRSPSPDELRSWLGGTDQPGWQMEVLSLIASSPEAASLGAKLAWLEEFVRAGGPARDHSLIAEAIRAAEPEADAGFIAILYEQLLGREVDPGGLDTWLQALASGLSRLDVISAIAASSEARGRAVSPRRLMVEMGEEDPGVTLRRIWRSPNAQFLRLAYHAILDREPDADGFAGHLAKLKGGLPRLNVVRDLASSEEASRLGDADWLNRLELETPRPAPTGSVIGTARATASLTRRARGYVGSLRRLPRTLQALRVELADVSIATVALSASESEVRADQAFHRVQLEKIRDDLRRLQNAAAQGSSVETRRAFEVALEAAERTTSRELSGSIDDAAAKLAALERMVDVLRRKQEAVSLDLRERMGEPSRSDPPPPRIPHPEGVERRTVELGGVKLNLGCGEKPLSEYLNVDFRELPDVDIVADVRRLPFDPGQVSEIASSHLVEHFRQHQLQTMILPYWHNLLRPGGLLRVICPNWKAMLDRVHNGEMTLDEFETVTFGLQDYDGDDHFAMYSPETLERTLRAAGFEDVELVEAGRRNGVSTEMELTARRPRWRDGSATVASRSGEGDLTQSSS